jgi:transcriptional regulator with XRE-family HTH domain
MTNTELKDFLKTYNLTQKKFASMIGKNLQTVFDWVHGKREIPLYVKLYIEKIEPTLKEAAALFKQMELREDPLEPYFEWKKPEIKNEEGDER